MSTFAAVDLGATSGRVMVGIIEGAPGAQQVRLHQVHRFANNPINTPAQEGQTTHLSWDIEDLWNNILQGLRTAISEYGELAGIGICSWAVDYGLIDAGGHLLANPVNYRDPRTEPVIEQAYERMDRVATYARNGLQHQPFTTAFQILAEDQHMLSRADKLLLIPDLLSYWLTGKMVAEYTNASTTGLVNAATRTWDVAYLQALGIDPDLLPAIVQPGTLIANIADDVARLIGATSPIPVWAVASHDTGSAVVGVPMQAPQSGAGNAAYISSGTWSLVGVELDEPVLSEESRAANVTNEGGVDGTIRYLKNVMGLWVLTETLRTWEAAGESMDVAEALQLANAETPGQFVIDINDPSLLPPGDMPARIAVLAQESGGPVPRTRGQIVRCILDSLAAAYRDSVAQISALADQKTDVVHIVGGGSQNELLCQLTADACGVPVIAGPAEGTALGNVLIQARGAGVIEGDLSQLRHVLSRSVETVRYQPRA